MLTFCMELNTFQYYGIFGIKVTRLKMKGNYAVKAIYNPLIIAKLNTR